MADRIRAARVAEITDEIMTVDRAAQVLAVRPSDVLYAIKKQGLPAYLHDNVLVLSRNAVSKWAKAPRLKQKATIRRVHHHKQTLVDAAEILSKCRPLEIGSGIYFLIRKGVIVYVGRAIHVEARIISHMKQKKFDAWHWVPCSVKDAPSLERSYIDALDPILNRDTLTMKRRASTTLAGGNHA